MGRIPQQGTRQVELLVEIGSDPPWWNAGQGGDLFEIAKWYDPPGLDGLPGDWRAQAAAEPAQQAAVTQLDEDVNHLGNLD